MDLIITSNIVAINSEKNNNLIELHELIIRIKSYNLL